MGDHVVRTTAQARTARSNDDVCDEGLLGVRVGRWSPQAPVGAIGVEVDGRVQRRLTTRWKQGCGGAGRQHGETTRD
jgi:hypothetical protein